MYVYRERDTYIYIYIYTHVYIYIYIYTMIYNELLWKEFVAIKLDARNLIEADVKSALTDLMLYHSR